MLLRSAVRHALDRAVEAGVTSLAIPGECPISFFGQWTKSNESGVRDLFSQAVVCSAGRLGWLPSRLFRRCKSGLPGVLEALLRPAPWCKSSSMIPRKHGRLIHPFVSQ
jgi:hypothetical protein